MADEPPQCPEFPSVSEAYSAVAASQEPDGMTKAAVVLLALGPELAANVLRLLTNVEIKRIASRLIGIRSFSKDQSIEVLRQFKEATSSRRLAGINVDEFMQAIEHDQRGLEAPEQWRDQLLAQIDRSALNRVEALEADIIYERIKDEHPQIMATVLAVLKPELSAALSACFEDALRNELLLRVALLERLQSVGWEELNEHLLELSLDSPEKRTRISGVKQSAALINALDQPFDDEALEAMRQHEPALAQRVEQQRFVFEDLLSLSAPSLQTLLSESSVAELALAMQPSSDALKKRLFASIPKPFAEAVNDFIRSSAQAKPEEVRQAQQAIIARGRSLHRSGRIRFRPHVAEPEVDG